MGDRLATSRGRRSRRLGALLVGAALVSAACATSYETVTAESTDPPPEESIPSTSPTVATSESSVPTPETTTATDCPFGGDTSEPGERVSSKSLSSDADHVRDVRFERIGGCGHVVIELGTDFAYSEPGGPADAVPAGTVVSVVDNTLRIRLAGVANVQFEDVRPDLGDGAILTRTLTRMAGTARDLEIVVYPSGEFTGYSAIFRSDPAVIVVDFTDEPSVDNLSTVPLVFDQVILESIGPRGEDGAISAGDVVFTGYARPFEAQMEVELVEADGTRLSSNCSAGCYLSGEPAEIQGVPTTDWGEAWGAFEFTLVDLAAGDHMIRMSNDAGAVDDPTWVEVAFTVES